MHMKCRGALRFIKTGLHTPPVLISAVTVCCTARVTKQRRHALATTPPWDIVMGYIYSHGIYIVMGYIYSHGIYIVMGYIYSHGIYI